MADRKVKLKDQLGRVVRLDDGDAGATLGKNLFGTDGKLLKPSDIINPPPEKQGAAATLWKLIREIPANIQALAAMGGVGFPTRAGDGAWFQRSLQPGTGIDVANGDGADGNPTISLEDLPNSGVGAALVKLTRDAKGRVSGTSSATTTDLAEGTNLYFTDARADARINLQKGQPNGLTPLGADSKIPSQYLPPLAITSTFVVNSQAAQLALDAQEGDVAVRTDLSKNYIHNAGTTGTMADWTELLTPAAPVQSVNGKTGTVVLVPGDIGAATAAQGAKADSALQPGAAHNTSLSGLQGGAAGEYYHATAAQNAALVALAISGYIDGLQMVWNSVNSVSFTSGTAAIPSLGALLRFPSAITKSGLSLAASTFYHAYGFSNSGTPDVEITTTAPSSPYLGAARTKTGDTSRRYLGSFLTDTSGFIHQFIQAGSLVLYPRGGAGGGSIFRVLSAKITAAEQAVSLSGVIPSTASGVFARFFFNRSIGDNAMNFGPTSGLPKLNNVTSPGVAFFTVPLTPAQVLYIILNNDVTDGNGAAYIDVNGYTYER